MDLPSDVVLLIGIPFARPSTRNQLIIKKLAEILGDEDSARLHGLILPAVFSAVQAAGRAVRSPEDRAMVLLADDRWKSLRRLLPRWFSERIEATIRLEDAPLLLEGVTKQ